MKLRKMYNRKSNHHYPCAWCGKTIKKKTNYKFIRLRVCGNVELDRFHDCCAKQYADAVKNMVIESKYTPPKTIKKTYDATIKAMKKIEKYLEKKCPQN